MKFETIDNISQLKKGDLVVYISDLYKWKIRQLQIIKIRGNVIICNNYVINTNEIYDIVKILK